jgi:DNA-binding SARP family transcriptional activator
MAALKVRLLGRFSVEVDGSPVEIRGVLLRSLVAILALSVGRPLPSELLIERLWEQRQPENPRATLHSAIARLRRVLGDSAITREQAAYGLAVDASDVDALAMLSYFTAAEAEPDTELRRQQLVQGLELWGEPLDGEFVDWLQQRERRRLQERYLTAIEQRIDLDLQEGRHDKVCTELQELADHHPLRESLWSRLVLALAGSGRRAEALAMYDRARRYLAEELGVNPGDELSQAFTSALTAEGPNEVAAVPVPEQLPSDLPGFTGRTSLLNELDTLGQPAAESGGNTVIVLHGEAGVGKTSAAVHWSQTRRDRFPEGQLYVNLSGYSFRPPVDPNDALEDLLRNLGVEGSAIPASLDGRSAMFRTVLANRRVLLVLDDARSPGQVRPLLPGGDAIVIVTSRSRMDGLAVRERGRQLAVEQLTTEEARAMLSEALKSSPAATEELDELADLCSRLPLALALAAAQVNRHPVLSVAALVDDLRDSASRLDVLGTDDDPATDFRVVLARSYDALDPAAARMFRALGTAGTRSVSVDCATALVAGSISDASRSLRRLTQLHLVLERVSGRFELHDLLASFAVEKATEVDDPQTNQQVEVRLLDWYLQSAHAARLAMGVVQEAVWPTEAPLDGVRPYAFASAADALAWFDRERRELVAAVVQGAQRGHDRLTAQLALHLWDFLERRSALDDSLLVQQVAARSARTHGDAVLEAAAANQLGTSYGRLGQGGEALHELERALSLFREHGNQDGELLVLGNLGLALRLVGRPVDSVGQFEEALEIARQRGDLLTVATLSNNLAATQLALGRTEAALESARNAIRLHDELADRRGLAYAYDTLGMVHLRRESPAEAIGFFEAALQIAREEDLHMPEIDTLVRVGRAWLMAGDARKARSCWQMALERLGRLPAGGGEDDAIRAEIHGLLDSLADVSKPVAADPQIHHG